MDHLPLSASRIGVGIVFGPVASWDAVVQGALLAEELGLDAIGFWDHYHADTPEWQTICGWSAYGYLAAITRDIKLVPMVLCRPNYLLGVLAKESTVLQIASDGRFELGIGAGDYPAEFAAWNVRYPRVEERFGALEESVAALREIWKGGRVSFHGDYTHLENAACAPFPPVPPRIVVGAGNSRRLIDAAVGYADELNVYGDRDTVAYAFSRMDKSGRSMPLSVFWRGSDDRMPDDLEGEILSWSALGATRIFMSVGFASDLNASIRRIARARDAVNAG